jgi:hypothetical protein
MSVAPTAVSSTLAALKAPPAQPQFEAPVVMGFNTLKGFELLQRGANALSKSTLVPQSFQNNLANCMIALNMANRLGADELMVMQNLYVVHGRPGWSAQFLIATFNQCGRFSAVRYRYFGTPGTDGYGCQAYATELASGEKIEGPRITIELAKAEGWYGKNGSKWKTMPDLMLMYRAAAWMIRTHAPEISMGLQTAEELNDVYDARPDTQGQYTVTPDELRASRGADAPAPPKDVELQNAEDAVVEQPAASVVDSADAIEALKGCDSLDMLKSTWAAVLEEFRCVGVPLDVEATYAAKREALAPQQVDPAAGRGRGGAK